METLGSNKPRKSSSQNDNDTINKIKELVAQRDFKLKAAEYHAIRSMGDLYDIALKEGRLLTPDDFKTEKGAEAINGIYKGQTKTLGTENATDEIFLTQYLGGTPKEGIQKTMLENEPLDGLQKIVNAEEFQKNAKGLSDMKMSKKMESLDIYNASTFESIGMGSIINSNRASSVFSADDVANLIKLRTEKNISPQQVGETLYDNPKSRIALLDSYIAQLENRNKPKSYQ